MSELPGRSEVLVVGAGPVGLAVAASLVGHGHGVTVVDRQATGANTSRAAVVHARTLEMLERIGVSKDVLIVKIRRRQIWVNASQRNRNDVTRTVVLATLALVGLRISELCALDGEDLDFAGRRIYVPRLRKDRSGQLVRVQGIKTEAAERVVPMLPALYDLLIDHKAEFGYGAHDPVFATRNGRRNTVDNVRRTIVDASVERANELLAARDQRERAQHDLGRRANRDLGREL